MKKILNIRIIAVVCVVVYLSVSLISAHLPSVPVAFCVFPVFFAFAHKL